MSQLFASRGQSIGASASASVLAVNIQGWFPLGWTGLISFLSKRLSRVFSNTTVQILQCSAFFLVQLLHLYMSAGKLIALTILTFVGNVMSLLFNTLSRLVIAFLPRSKCLLISCLQSPYAVILEPKKIKVCHCFCFPFCFPWSDGTRCHRLSLLNVECFHSPLSPSRGAFSSSSLPFVVLVLTQII